VSALFSIDDKYAEDVRLEDGTPIRLRQVRPSDKQRLVDGLARLSLESRRGRFFSPKGHFTPQELRYLTEFDGVNHLAIGAVELKGRRKEEGAGLGIARFVRLQQEPEVAEAAVVVLDAMQGKGIGHLLLERLVAAAIERAIKRFRSQMLTRNSRVREMILDAFPETRFINQGSVVVAEFLLPEHVTLSHGATPFRARLSRLLRFAAERLVEFRPASGALWMSEQLRGHRRAPGSERRSRPRRSTGGSPAKSGDSDGN
jgi:GNAT superfamily N-acetyltransferase